MGFRNSGAPGSSNQLRTGGPEPKTPSVTSEGKASVVPTSKGTGRRRVPTAKALAGKKRST